jgi:hypothetical protein
MSGRRRHQRFLTGGSYEGSLRIRREVVVGGPGEDGTLSVVSDVPGVPDEVLMLDLMAQRAATSLMVQVIDSRPVIVDGAVRHTLRLTVLEGWQRPA